MKKILFTLIIALFSTAVSARINNGPYLTVRGGIAGTSTEVSGLSGSKQSDTDFLYAAAVGARARNMRIEFEFASSSKVKYEEAEYLKQRYMAQFYYDVPLNLVVRPYLNAGAGVNYTDVSWNGENDDGTSFAWNAGAGLSVYISQAMNLDIGYRYFDGGKKEFLNLPEISMTSHEGYIGFRYTF